MFLVGCGGGSSPPPPPPPLVNVTLSPATASPFLGATQQFTATVMNSSNTSVTWSVNGVSGGNATQGTVDANGLFTAPPILPMPAIVTVRATSVADPSKSAASTVTVTSDLAVNVTPAPAAVELGAGLVFTATVTGSGNPNRAVTWSVNSVPGGNATVGIIDGAGMFTAPSILPAPATVIIAATSVADLAESASAAATVTSNFLLSVAGPAALDNGLSAQFTATLTPVPGSNPNPGITWGVSGPGCGQPGACGQIDATGLYTAPAIAPNPSNLTITATSIADASRLAAHSLTINAILTVTVTPAASTVFLEGMQQFSAAVAGTVNQNVTWDVDGIVGGDQATVGAISQGGLYFAPVNMPLARQATVRATSQAQPSAFDAVVVSLSGAIILVTLAPAAEARAINRRLQMQVAVNGSSNTVVNLTVNGVPGGDLNSGQICLMGSAPCLVISTAQSGEVFEYLAPATVPATPNVTIRAASQADLMQTGTATVTILPFISLTLSPAGVTLPLSATQIFTATLSGTSSRHVSWTVNGMPNGDAGVGQVCVPAINPCLAPTGPVSDRIEYRSPAVAPVPPNLSLLAASVEDPAQSAASAIAITTGPFISGLLPASVTAGPASSFLLRVTGSGFSPSAPGPGSTILFGGAPQSTTCLDSSTCQITIAPADAAAAGMRAVQVQNPGMPPVPSNQVDFALLAEVMAEEVIPLTAGTPAASNKDVRVAEPPTAAQPATEIQVTAIGLLVANACAPRAGPVVLTRPAVGTSSLRICVFGDNLTVAQSYSLSGPGDIILTNPILLGTNLVELNLTVPSSAQPGARTLFVQNMEKARVAASGAVEVK